jgi:hypothetical protein
MFPASRFALPAALSLSLSSLAVSAALADGTAAPAPQPAARLRPWTETLPPSLGERFTQLLQREAKGHMDLASIRPVSAAPAAGADPVAPAESGSDPRVQSMLTRALRGVLDEELATLAQRAPFASLLRLGSGRSGAIGTDAAAGDPVRQRFDATLGMRLDAHPRLQLRTSLGAFSGTVEVPILDPELRVGVERSLGPAGRASLHAGAGGAHGDWATLSFSFGF